MSAFDFEYSDWRPTQTGGWWLPDDEAVIFQKQNIMGGWAIAKNGRFSKGSYNTPEKAAEAYEGGQVSWVYPYAWKPKKDGTGYYRHSEQWGVLSVRQAKSGSWYWVAKGNSPQGWFDSANDAKMAADAA